ncbi:MAG TPA: Na+/H+ antiporter subunit G [Geminicoccaceae bacterium]|nr:Na+/H+ antiporter subunit G [Geminicoccus sp.]HMU49827.1 Na+/H+ antiporter subunit G [Geminicoccaceae bacterium]
MTLLAEAVVALLALTGGFFLLVGSYGLAKLPDFMTRLHAPTKSSTLGVGSCLLASLVYHAALGDGLSFHELLITLFLFLTAPVTANMLAKAHFHRDRRTAASLPPDRNGSGWATLADPPPSAKR